MGHKNPIVAKNFIGDQAEARRAELQKARQNFQQNSFKVGSPSIVYYQQVRNGYVCTCHAAEKPVEEIEGHTSFVGSDLSNFSDKVTEISFSTINKTPMFGMIPTNDEMDDEESKLLDDTESPGTSLFANLFHKGTDCGLCFRSGFTPLLHPVGRQFYALTTHNVKELGTHRIDPLKFPNLFVSHVRGAYVEWEIKVPKYFQSMSYAVYNNTIRLDQPLTVEGTTTILNKEYMDNHRGRTMNVQVRAPEFTHVFIEFELGIEIHANFPQFSMAKDYSYFMNLQQVTIELPPSICNPQVNDLIHVPEWDRLWMVFDIQPKMDGPLQNIILGTSVQGRLVQSIETSRNITKLKKIER